MVRLELRPEPVVGGYEVLVAARFAGINTGDLVQRAGARPAPPKPPQDVPVAPGDAIAAVQVVGGGDVVLDRNLDALPVRGRIVVVGIGAGADAPSQEVCPE
jgi:hypothetical protein